MHSKSLLGLCLAASFTGSLGSLGALRSFHLGNYLVSSPCYFNPRPTAQAVFLPPPNELISLPSPDTEAVRAFISANLSITLHKPTHFETKVLPCTIPPNGAMRATYDGQVVVATLQTAAGVAVVLFPVKGYSLHCLDLCDTRAEKLLPLY